MAAPTPRHVIADPSHWPGIWSVFREVIAAGDTFMPGPDTTEPEARAAWMFDGSGLHVTFATILDGKVVASAIIKPNAVGLGDHIANGGWIVSPAARGFGIGRSLAEYAIEHARRLGFYGMQFNAVVASNSRAIALWRSLGFEIVGTVPDAFRHAVVGLTPIHIMYRKL